MLMIILAKQVIIRISRSVVSVLIQRFFLNIAQFVAEADPQCYPKYVQISSCRSEIIRCLSEVRFEHKVLGSNSDLSEPCKKQLKVAYLQQEQVEVSCVVGSFR